jgi:hypothetical protein
VLEGAIGFRDEGNATPPADGALPADGAPAGTSRRRAAASATA